MHKMCLYVPLGQTCSSSRDVEQKRHIFGQADKQLARCEKGTKRQKNDFMKRNKYYVEDLTKVHLLRGKYQSCRTKKNWKVSISGCLLGYMLRLDILFRILNQI